MEFPPAWRYVVFPRPQLYPLAVDHVESLGPGLDAQLPVPWSREAARGPGLGAAPGELCISSDLREGMGATLLGGHAGACTRV